jgi:hypothetical protein
MHGNARLRGLRIGVVIAAAVAVSGLVVMELWNWLIPALVGWHSLSYPQALGLLLLCRILFGGFRGRAGLGWGGRWRHMSEAERERFRAEMRWRCGRAPESEQPASGG